VRSATLTPLGWFQILGELSANRLGHATKDRIGLSLRGEFAAPLRSRAA